jgi:DUF1365 family protein
MRSRLYVGTVMHHRLTQPRHRFRYRVYYHLLDLDELDSLEHRLRLFGYRRRRPVRFLDADHLGGRGRPVRESVCDYLRSNGIADRPARIDLLTQCRVFGFVFNPVSFYYCYAGDESLIAVVAEVHNTFGERHCYLLRADQALGGNQWHEKKVFHVSPFLTLAGTYAFEMGMPGDRLDIGIDLERGGSKVFTSRLALEARPLTDAALCGVLVRYPLMPHAIVAAIHRQAFALWRKGLTYYPKPPYDPEAARGGES